MSGGTEKNAKDVSHQNAIHVETIRKELRHQKLHTEFSINPHRKLHILPDKPLCRKPKEVITENSDFIKAFHKARQEPTKKYAMPVTESQEIGWLATAVNTPHRKDERLNFYRQKTDVTKYHEFAHQSSN